MYGNTGSDDMAAGMSNNQIYIFFGFIVIIVFIIIGYYIKSCSDCKAEDTCCQRSDLKTFCFTDCTLETESPETGDNKVDCIGSWSEWSACTKDCGGGLKKRTYSITREASNGGEQCPFKNKLEQEVICNTSPCPVDCIGQWGDWDECSVGCTNDGSGSGIQEKSYSVMINSQHGGEECSEEDGTTMSRVCNDGLLCHIDCEGSWERTNCQVNDIDVVCGESERTYTFTTTIPPINDGETCLEKYGNEIPEYLRSQIGDTLESGYEVSEQCNSTSATALPVSYVERVCSDCNLHEYVLENRSCEECGFAEKTNAPKNPESIIYEGKTEDSCIPFTCGIDQRVNSDTKSCEDCSETYSSNYGNRERDEFNDDITTHTRTECHRLTCGDWFNEGGFCPSTENENYAQNDKPGYSEAECCNDGSCGSWFDYIESREGGVSSGQMYVCSNKQINEESDSDNAETDILIELGHENFPLEKQLYKKKSDSFNPSNGVSAETCCEKKKCQDLYNWSPNDSCRVLNDDWRLKESNRGSNDLVLMETNGIEFGGQCCEYGSCQDAYDQGCRCGNRYHEDFPELKDTSWDGDERVIEYNSPICSFTQRSQGGCNTLTAYRDCYPNTSFSDITLRGLENPGIGADDPKCLYFQRNCCEFREREYRSTTWGGGGHYLKSCGNSGYRSPQDGPIR